MDHLRHNAQENVIFSTHCVNTIIKIFISKCVWFKCSIKTAETFYTLRAGDIPSDQLANLANFRRGIGKENNEILLLYSNTVLLLIILVII